MIWMNSPHANQGNGGGAYVEFKNIRDTVGFDGDLSNEEELFDWAR